MSYKFISQPLHAGIYEPEGIYLSTPIEGQRRVTQFWGDHPDFYKQFMYNSVPLKGHPGLDLAAPIGVKVYAIDKGRVMELGHERGGFGRYLKIEHVWGESLYANLSEILVDSGQQIRREDIIALLGAAEGYPHPHLHFAIRLKPYNRFDGWGGFADPLPFLDPQHLLFPEEHEIEELPPGIIPPMMREPSQSRRP